MGFSIVRIGVHISMIRENKDRTKTPLTMPNHDTIKGSTLRFICRQSGIKRNDFFENISKSVASHYSGIEKILWHLT